MRLMLDSGLGHTGGSLTPAESFKKKGIYLVFSPSFSQLDADDSKTLIEGEATR